MRSSYCFVRTVISLHVRLLPWLFLTEVNQSIWWTEFARNRVWMLWPQELLKCTTRGIVKKIFCCIWESWSFFHATNILLIPMTKLSAAHLLTSVHFFLVILPWKVSLYRICRGNEPVFGAFHPWGVAAQAVESMSSSIRARLSFCDDELDVFRISHCARWRRDLSLCCENLDRLI